MVQSNRSLAESMKAAERKLFSDYEQVNELAKSRNLSPLQERKASELQEFRKRAAQMLNQLAEYFEQLANSNAEPVNGFEAIRQKQNNEL
jgi:Mg2+ and Co2+ transporter CorA